MQIPVNYLEKALNIYAHLRQINKMNKTNSLNSEHLSNNRYIKLISSSPT